MKRGRKSGQVPSFDSGIRVVTVAQMREIDRRTIDAGVPGAVLMERAGQGAVEALRSRFPRHLRHGAVIVAGKGNNGGDALVMARYLRRRRVRCDVFLAAPPESLTGDAARNLRRLRAGGGRVRRLDREGLPALAGALEGDRVVVDGLFGIGLHGSLDERSKAIIETINMAPGPIVSVDVPSGLDADRGVALGGAVQASLTITFAFPKVGLLLHPGVEYAGDIAVVDIGVSSEAVAAVAPQQWLAGPELIAAAVPPRAPDSHKGTYGHVLVIGGSVGKCGAAILAAKGGLRSGAGLVTVASPKEALAGVLAAAPEIMTEPLESRAGAWTFSANDAAGMLRVLDGKSSVVFGPGIGQTPATRALTEWLVGACPVPMVIDADGLNCMAGHVGWLRRRKAPTVLTPHPGEMARLIGRSIADVQADRLGVARGFATEHGVVVVLKGPRSVIAAPDGMAWINPTGNPGMASGGMGDALAGILGTLLAQGVPMDEAAAAGVFWHGFAADRVTARRGEGGLLASDVIEELPPALREAQGGLLSVRDA